MSRNLASTSTLTSGGLCLERSNVEPSLDSSSSRSPGSSGLARDGDLPSGHRLDLPATVDLASGLAALFRKQLGDACMWTKRRHHRTSISRAEETVQVHRTPEITGIPEPELSGTRNYG